jgi:hypothetical protein
MAGETPSSNGMPHDGALPPVEPPSARFILQLFLVPLLLVGIFGVAIFFLFGWLGLGSTDPAKLIDDLEGSTSEDVRWMRAQDLAQVLPRNDSLRGDVGMALRLADILQREMAKPPPAVDDDEQRDYLRFLPGALGSFHVPIGVPLFQEIIAANSEKLDSEGTRLRLYHALVAIGAMGSRLREYDALPEEEKERIRGELGHEASGTSNRAAWSRLALEYLRERDQRASKPTSTPQRDVYGLAASLAPAARASDELARKYAIIALGNWQEPGVDSLLRELAGDNGEVTNFEDGDAERGRREIRSNAALALARRGSPLTPWHLVVDALDEDKLRTHAYEKNSEMATAALLKAIRDLRALREAHPEVLASQADVNAALDRLADSPTAVVQVEARKTLGAASTASAAKTVVSRELLLIGTFGLFIVFLLALAVFARWRRKAPPPEVPV